MTSDEIIEAAEKWLTIRQARELAESVEMQIDNEPKALIDSDEIQGHFEVQSSCLISGSYGTYYSFGISETLECQVNTANLKEIISISSPPDELYETAMKIIAAADEKLRIDENIDEKSSATGNSNQAGSKTLR